MRQGGKHLASAAIVAAALREAGALIRDAWRRGRSEAQTKGSAIDLVTATDGAAEALIQQRLRAAFPDDQMLLEEGGHQAGNASRCWYVDPLDGTTNFAHGLPQFCATAALEEDGALVVGVTYDVVRDELYQAVRGQGATVDGAPLSVSSTEALGRAVLATGFPYDRWSREDNNSKEHLAFLQRARGVRRMGSAALDLAFLARGWFDGYWEMRLNPWDVAAGALLVEEAGGKVSGYGGGPLVLGEAHIVASNGRIHEAIVETLAGVRGERLEDVK